MKVRRKYGPVKLPRKYPASVPVADQSIRVSKRTLKKLRQHKLGSGGSYNFVIERSLDFLDILDPGMRKLKARMKAQGEARARGKKMKHEIW